MNLLQAMNYYGESPKLELKLKLSPPTDHRQVLSTTTAASNVEISCVSREDSPDSGTASLRYSSSTEGSTMMLVGCPRCLMYVMLFEDDPKCPKCKSTVLLDFLHDRTRRINK